MIDFAKLQVRTKANKRGPAPLEKDFVWKFERYERTKSGETVQDTRYVVSDTMWENMKFDTNGLGFAFDEETKTSFVQVLPEDRSLVLRGTKAGEKKPRFKAEVLDKDLIAAGLVPATGLCSVKLNVEKPAEAPSGIFKVTLDDGGDDVLNTTTSNVTTDKK